MADIAEVWGYMDETGHSRDQKQRFNGMAGLIAPAENWNSLTVKWNKVLEEFHIPYFHMKDWAIHGASSPAGVNWREKVVWQAPKEN
jgi:hypothetical protein